MHSDYLPGPDPILTPPSLAQAVNAEHALQRALATNAKAGALQAGVSPAQAETLLDWIVYRARASLLPLRMTLEDPQAVAYFSPEKVKSECGFVSACVNFQAGAMGLQSRFHEVMKHTESNRYKHSISVVTIPVFEHGTVRLQPYLIDGTYRQFCSPNPARALVPANAWPCELIKSPEGRVIVHGLLTKGFVPLTQDTAARYIGAAEFDKYLGEPMQVDHRYARDQLLGGHTDTPLCTPEFLVKEGFDLRTPSMVETQTGRDAVAAAYRARIRETEADWWHEAQIAKPNGIITIDATQVQPQKALESAKSAFSERL